MFNNVGEKIKAVAKILFYIGSVFYGLIGMTLLFVGCAGVIPLGDTAGILIGVFGGVLIAAGGILGSWVVSLFVYGFGELVTGKSGEASQDGSSEGQQTDSQTIGGSEYDGRREQHRDEDYILKYSRSIPKPRLSKRNAQNYTPEDLQKVLTLQEYVRAGMITQEEYLARMDEINSDYIS